jgi:hypothetical protein
LVTLMPSFVQMVFRPGAVDATSTQAAYGAITMAEEIPDFDVDIFLEAEYVGTSPMMHDRTHAPSTCSELQDDTLTYEFTAQHADDLRLDEYRPSQVLDPMTQQDLMEDMAPFGQSTILVLICVFTECCCRCYRRRSRPP